MCYNFQNQYENTLLQDRRSLHPLQAEVICLNKFTPPEGGFFYCMKEAKKVLDIGIGHGGLYVKRTPDVIRIGFDKRSNNMRDCMRLYPVHGVVGNANQMSGSLPFAEKSFTHIDVLFPHQSLFYSMCHSIGFWQELNRVLHDQGSVRAVFDTTNDRRYVSRGPIDNPEKLILDMMDCSGFDGKIITMKRYDINKLGTMFSHSTLVRMRNEGKSTKVYSLIGYKR
ncbi:MAG: hypothetical protein ACOYUB_03260 [Patescibacteria group bacterium]